MQEKPGKMPKWLHIRPKGCFTETFDRVHEHGLHTVCEEASCPNLALCYRQKRASFLLLGPVCTRKCAFCGIGHAMQPQKVDPNESERVAAYCRKAQIRHVVLTMVTRDDLCDGGAAHVSEAIMAVRSAIPGCSLEVLASDFNGNMDSLRTLLGAKPDVFAHNIETVEALTQAIRSVASYRRSLQVLKNAKECDPQLVTKSGLMLGFGETEEQVYAALSDLREAQVDMVTIGQYLRPSPKQISVQEYVPPERFKAYETYAVRMGFTSVLSGPFVRSSLNIEEKDVVH
jgi:lipoyl synthase